MPNLQSRQQLSRHDLIDLLNFELAAYEECEGCHVTGIELTQGSWKAALVAGVSNMIVSMFHVKHCMGCTS